MNKLSEEEIIEECNKLFVTMANVHIDGKAMADLLDLYQKEKEKNKVIEVYRHDMPPDCELVVMRKEDFERNYSNEYISKDKIKMALGIEEDATEEQILNYIDILVSENARLEDIEDKKVQIEYQNVFNKGAKSVEDKIKAKIEELEAVINEFYNSGGNLTISDEFQNKIEVLQELLEKEDKDEN